MARLLCVVVDDLKQVVLRILKDHEDTLVFEENLDELDNVGMPQLAAQRHLADGALRDAGVGNLLAFLIGLELLDGEFADLALTAEGLIDASIGTTANETNDSESLGNSDFGLVSDVARPSISRIFVTTS